MRKLNVILLLGQILTIVFTWRRFPPELPLFYSLPWGKEQLTTPVGLFLLPLLSLSVFFLNLLLTFFITQQEKLIQKMLDTAAAVFSLLCLTTLIKIITLIT